jgi:oxalate decarboxylase/phosphoglucose isomerase-like protein (cupin superfamily)
MTRSCGRIVREYHWHKHDADDEFFYVVSGRFWIDLEDRVIELARAGRGGAKKSFIVERSEQSFSGRDCRDRAR